MTRNPLRLLRPALVVAALATTGSAVAQNTPAVSVAASDKPHDVAWAAMPIDELRQRAHANEVPAMEELGRRLIAGAGVPRDQQTGVAWFQRAADAGSPTAAFNVGVMYDRGFVLEHNAEKAVEWYRKAVAGGVAAGQAQSRADAARGPRRTAGRPQGGRAAARSRAPGHDRVDVRARRHVRAWRRGAEGSSGSARLVRDHHRVGAAGQPRHRDGLVQGGADSAARPCSA